MSSERVPTAHAALEADYEIVRELGRGGTALVYLARERATGAEVAIKLIRAKYIEDDEALARFAREARFVAQLDHPNIVPVRTVLDLGTSGIALVMAHVAGRTLKQVIREEHPISAERTEQMMRGVANGLGAAHALGIVHRDVKPENIFIDSDGRALLADFGLARSMTADAQLTMAGVAIGTPAYMAPEQIDGDQLDARGDIYSLGLVAWETLTGRRPWDGESLYAVLYHQKYEQLPDVRDMRGDVPDYLADAIARSIEKDRDARWQSVNELTAALDRRTPGRPSTARTPVTNDTIQFTRPLTPGVAAAVIRDENVDRADYAEPVDRAHDVEEVVRRDYDDRDAALASVVAEFEAAERAANNAPRRRYVVAGSALVAVVVIALVATAVQGRVRDRHRQTQDGLLPTADAGDVAKTPMSGARADPAGRVPADTSRVTLPTVKAASNAAPGRDSAVPVSLGAAGIKAVAPQPVPGRSSKTAAASVDSATATARKSASSPQGMPATNSTMTPPSQPPVSVPVAAPPVAAPIVAPIVAPAAPATSHANLVAGGMHSCLVSTDGRAFCWGGNDHGQLGNGATARTASPSAVGGDLRFSAVAAGLSHSCAIARGGAAWCWGENDHGQLGDRSSTARSTPARVAEGHAFRAIVAGVSHSCGLDAAGAAWCWGSNTHGQLGDSTSHDANIPVGVAGGRIFASITAGWNFTCGLDADGHAFCWGDDTAGQLGDDAAGTDRRVLVPVSGGLTFTSIAAGNAHACGITTQGDAFCWGRNVNGQLGDGTSADRSTPVRVKGSAHFASVAAGGVHTCAITEEGEAYCWGRNTYGQLGDGGTTDRNQPVRVAGGHAFASVRAFGSHTCGATVSGEAFCWGYNLDGQLGDGTRTHRTRPVYIEPPSGG